MEEEWPLKLVNLNEEVCQGWDTSRCQLEVFYLRLDKFRAVFYNINVRLRHDLDKLVAHIFHLDSEFWPEASIPFLLNPWINYVIDILWVDLEVQVKRLLFVQWFLFKLRNRDWNAEKNSFYSLACKEALHVWTDDFNLDLTKSICNRYVEHLVDWVVEDFANVFALLLKLSFDRLISIYFEANNFPRSHNEWVTCNSNKERVRACQII